MSEWVEERGVAVPQDELSMRAQALLEAAFGSPFERLAKDRFSARLGDAKSSFRVDVHLSPVPGGDTKVRTTIAMRRSAPATLGVTALATAAAAMWMYSASFFVRFWRNPVESPLEPILLIVVPLIATFLALRMARATRSDAMALIDPLDQFHRSLDALADRPRIGGHRERPRIASFDDATEEARAHEEAELEAERAAVRRDS